MLRRPPRSTRTDTLCPYTPLFRSTWSSGGFALAYEYNSNTAIEASQRSYARDTAPGLTLFPALKSHSALLTGHQALGERLTFSIDALYNRRNEFSVYPLDVGGDLAALHGEMSGRSRSRSEERRVGKECVSTCRTRWSPYH